MTPQDLYTVIGSSVGSIVIVGLTLAVLIMRTTTRLDRRIDEASADRRAFQSEAAADRRAQQQSMDEFRARMQRLAERRGDSKLSM